MDEEQEHEEKRQEPRSGEQELGRQVGEQRDEGPQRAERLGSQWLEQEVLDEEGLQ